MTISNQPTNQRDQPAQLALNMKLAVTMLFPCRECGSANGTISTDGGRDQTHCDDCGRFCYSLPSTETGRPRSVRSRPAITHRQKVRILLRDKCRCILCDRRGVGVDLQIGHLTSVRDGQALGLSDAYLSSDGNLAAMCASCNAGLGGDSVPLRFLLALQARRQKPPA